jgi:hypothetical protein
MLMPSIFYIDAPTGTFADQLRAAGAAEVIRVWQEQVGKPGRVILEHIDSAYRIKAATILTEGDIANVTPFVAGHGIPLGSKRQQAKALEVGRDLGKFFDYEEEVARRDAWRTALQNMDPQTRKRYLNNPNSSEFEGLPGQPSPDLNLYIAINHFKSASNYNDLLATWLADNDADAFREHLRLFVATFSQTPNVPLASKDDVTQVQMVNPGSGKGVYSVKADALRSGNLSGHWLDEYLKFVGFFTTATPILLQGSKDRKTYVLRPHSIEVQFLAQVMRDFRGPLGFSGGSSLKADIMASLQFTAMFIEYVGRLLHQPDAKNIFDLLVGKRVVDIAEGFDVGFYKDMGSAYATMNLSTINFPNWLEPINTEGEAQKAGGVLKEHIDVIRSIRTRKGDERSDEIDLLQRYREFLSGRDPLLFFDFAAHFGGYALGHMHDNIYIARFTTHGMENLIAMTDGGNALKLTPIVTSSGFKEIAAAIRRATVIAQRLATPRSGYPYEVRYGLGQELLRAAMYPETFIAELSTFIQSYNAESARIDERIAKGTLTNLPQYRRARVTTSAIDEIVRLIDAYPSGVVCKLLIAYGYARDPRAPDDTESKSTEDQSGNDISAIDK